MRSYMAVTALLFALPFVSTASEFDWMTREFARQSGTQPLHIPFFGLARFVVAVAHPAGASDLKLAVFEHTNIGSDQFSHLADATVGIDWRPIVRVRQNTGDVSNIYVQPEGKHLRVLVASFAKDEVVFVQVRIRPEELMRFVDQQRRNQRGW